MTQARRSTNRIFLAVALFAAGALAGAPAVAVAGAGHGGATNSLTTQYPLGRQKLCCSSQTSPAASPTPATTRRSSSPRRAGGALGVSTAGLVVAAALAGVLLLAAAGYGYARRRRPRPPGRRSLPSAVTRPRTPVAWHETCVLPRPRYRAPGWMIVLLWPVMRYSPSRGAYVLRLVGRRLGPVLIDPGPVRPPGRWMTGGGGQQADRRIEGAGDRQPERRAEPDLLAALSPDDRGHHNRAQAARRLATNRHARAATKLGMALEQRGDLDGARRAYLDAKRWGDPAGVERAAALSQARDDRGLTEGR